MPTITEPNLPLSDIVYHDYAAMLTFLEVSPKVRLKNASAPRDPDVLHRVAEDFTTACCRCRYELERNIESLNQINAENRRQSRIREFPNHLLNPALFVAFGRVDAIGIALLDDFDHFITITADIKSPIDQTILAFCPKMKQLAKDLEIEDSPFCELDELLCGKRPVYSNGKAKPSTHPFQTDTPLLAVTRLKLDGMAVLEQGLLLQRAAFRAMARKICEVRRVLLEKIQNNDSQMAELGISTQDITTAKCVFLDAQGSEDITLLISCRHYSVAAAMIASLRCLTFMAIFEEDPHLVDLLNRAQTKTHSAMVALGLEALGRGSGDGLPDVRKLQDNHVLSTTYTTLGVSAPVFNGDLNNCNGVVEPFVLLDTHPGHLRDVEDLLAQIHKKVKPICDEQASSSRPYSTAKNYMRVFIGRYDSLLVLSDDPNTHPLRALPLHQLLIYLKTVVSELEEHPFRTNQQRGIDETGLMGINSMLVIPIPRLDESLIPPVGHSHVPLLQILQAIRDAMLESEAGNVAPFDMRNLEKAMRRLDIPWSLRSTVLYLYQSFANCLSDPHMFSGVLDLYDVFATLYSWITKHLDKRPKDRPVFGQTMVDSLNGLLNALQNALMHRVYMILPNTEIRDNAVDFRGGLNKLVATTDVPLKCGLLLLRLNLSQPSLEPYKKITEEASDKIAAVTRLDFHPQTVCHSIFTPGTAKSCTMCLAHVRMNVSHIFRPSQFVTYFHEIAHLIFRSRWPKNQPGTEEQNNPHLKSLEKDRLEEIFVGFLTHLIVFGTDTKLYRRFYMADYSMQPLSVGTADDEPFQDDPEKLTRLRFMEVMTRMFLVTDTIKLAVRDFDPDPLAWPREHPLCRETDKDIYSKRKEDEAVKRFRKFVDDIGPFFRGFEDWCEAESKEAVVSQCIASFRFAFKRSFLAVVEVWEEAIRVYQGFFSEIENRGAITEKDSKICTDINESLKQRKPLVRDLCLPPSQTHRRTVERSPSVSIPDALDTIHLVSRLLRTYLEKDFEPLKANRGLHLHRNEEDGQIDLSKGLREHHKGLNDYLLDKSHGDFFCIDPKKRGERLSRKIITLKILWDISTRFRSERLYKLITEHWRRTESH